jgi:hypothetical protein
MSDPVASTNPLVLFRSALAFPKEILESLETICGIYHIDKYDSPIDKIKWIREFSGVLPLSHMPKGTNNPIGKLGLKVEAAGKMRVFAMVDPWTQWILAPLHKGIFHVLERIPQDGTFQQTKPLKAAFEGMAKPLFSMDLSAATDRLPIRIQKPLIASLFGMSQMESDAWVNILVGRKYNLSAKMNNLTGNKYLNGLTYSVGQPMGALSSWAMLAFTHHFIVQSAAWETGVAPKGSWFPDYAILGDDIVIFNAKVAKAYHRLIVALGVECNLAKSICSPKGTALEFAKKTIYRGTDVSPISLKGYYAALESVPALVEFGKTYHLTLSQLLKVAGFGYKVLGGLTQTLKKQNTKIQYVIFGLMTMNPISLQESFFNIVYFRNKADVLKAYLLFVSQWCNTVVDKMIEELDTLYTFDPVAPKGLKYLWRPLFDDVYGKYIEKMFVLRQTFVEEIGNKKAELDDFIKYDVNHYTKKGLPIQCEPIILDEVSSLLFETMRSYSRVVSMPVSLLNSQHSTVSSFSFGKGAPSLYFKHKTFIELLHGKDHPMREASFLPLGRLILPLIRRKGVGRLLTLTKLQVVRKLIFSTSIVCTLASTVSLAVLVLGPTKVLIFLGSFISSLAAVSSTVAGIPGLEYVFNVIEKIALIVIFLSGIVILSKWDTFHTGMLILKEQLEDGMSFLDYLFEVIKLTHHITLSLLAEYGGSFMDIVTHGSLWTGYSFGILGSMLLYYILK